jgi:uncharacterized protein (DUF1778 family)
MTGELTGRVRTLHKKIVCEPRTGNGRLFHVLEITMPRVVKRKKHPLSMRLPEADIAIIDRAANLRGRSRTDFVREAAVHAADDVLMETAPIRMSPSGFKAFMKVLSKPARPVPELIELFQRAARWESKDAKAGK